MSALHGFFLTFSIYSALPAPSGERDRKSMDWIPCFFPFVGVLTASVISFLWALRLRIGVFVPFAVFAFAGSVVPVLLSGGIHLEGFFHTMESLRRGERKDAPKAEGTFIGASAAVSLICERFLYAAALFLTLEERQALYLGIGFVLSRTLAAIAAVLAKGSGREDASYLCVSDQHRGRALAVLSLWLLLAAAGAYVLYGIAGISCAALSLPVFFLYAYMARRRADGLPERLSGCFIVVYELVFVWLTGSMGYVWNLL